MTELIIEFGKIIQAIQNFPTDSAQLLIENITFKKIDKIILESE